MPVAPSASAIVADAAERPSDRAALLIPQPSAANARFVIEYDARRWVRVIFQRRGSIAPRLLGRTLFSSLLGIAAVEVDQRMHFALSPIAHTMIGAALGLLLVFRTNASYDRYWEGRRLIGGIISRSRDLARQLAAFLPGVANEADRRRMRGWIESFYWLATQTLRNETRLEAVASLSASERESLKESGARPYVVATWIAIELARLTSEGKLSEQRLRSMDANLSGLIDSLTGCERILRTPVPFAYAQHIKTFVVLFCFTAPFTMSDAMGWLTPIASGLLAFALMGIDEIGVEIEDPFGTDANDLPLDVIGERIGRDTREVLAARA